MVERAQVDALGWFHSIELPGGVVTPGLFDQRSVVGKLPLPESFVGQRCIDVAASDGFWSFEMARRGADEVVSTDLDDVRKQDVQGVSTDEVPGVDGPGRASSAFYLAHDALGLPNVKRVDVSVYDLDPDVHGLFDYAFMGNILLHLSDPARAVAALKRVLRPDAHLMSLEAISLPLTLLSTKRPLAQLFELDGPRWWTPNRAAYRRFVEAGGFEVLRSGGPVFQRLGSWRPRIPRRVPRSRADLHYWTFVRQFGLPSAWVLARPRPARSYKVTTVTGVLQADA
ncbi:MAG: class I SAM-dependent methyltransferase [Acidimicrobiales bacterium]